VSETPVSGNIESTERLLDALVATMGCVGEALEDICSYSVTIGETYVPFDPDEDDECEEGEALCSQAWVRVMNVVPILKEDSFAGESCSTVLQLGLEIGVLRCFGIEEEGEAPTATDVLAASMQAMVDMKAIYCAMNGCETGWDDIESGTWSPMGPLGGQYGGQWTFTVEV
jgi:hypothetical protein